MFAGLIIRTLASIENRHRDLGRAGIVRANVNHDVRIVFGFVGILRLLFRVPRAGSRGRIVEIFIFDRKIADLIIRFVQRELDAVDDRVCLALGTSRCAAGWKKS